MSDARAHGMPSAEQVEGVLVFVENFMGESGRGFRDGPFPLSVGPEEGWPDERLVYAASWLRHHADEIVDYMVDSECATED